MRAPRKPQREERARPGSEASKKTWFDGTKVLSFARLVYLAHYVILCMGFHLFIVLICLEGFGIITWK